MALLVPWYLVEQPGGGWRDVRLFAFRLESRRRVTSGPYAGCAGTLIARSHSCVRDGMCCDEWAFRVALDDGSIAEVLWYELEGAPRVPQGHERDEEVRWLPPVR